MKKRFSHLLFVIAVVIGFVGCTKESIEEVTGSMKATIDGTQWEATIASQLATKYSDYIAIGGYNISGQKIFIAINGTTAKEYDLAVLAGSTQVASFFIENKTGSDTERYLSTAGKVVITSISDTRISGTFQFTATRTVEGTVSTKQITSGEFKNVVLVTP